jgi:CysZ protein
MNAFQAYRQSITFLGKHGLRWFMWFPLIITVLVFVGGFSLTNMATDWINGYLEAWFGSQDWLPEWAGFLADVFYWILWIVLRILLYFALAFVGGSVILLLMAPILTYLSEKVAAAIGKDVPAFSITQFTRDLTRAIGLALRNGVIQLALTIACFLIGLIPVVGAASPFLLFGINAYYYGYNFMDYSLERYRFSVSESNGFVWKHKGSAFTLGTPFAAWMLIPFIGPMTAGFVAILATVAATLRVEGIQDKAQLAK